MREHIETPRQVCAVRGIDLVYQLAADMGGAGYLFTATINPNMLEAGRLAGVTHGGGEIKQQ
jgi:hypothetical protein